MRDIELAKKYWTQWASDLKDLRNITETCEEELYNPPERIITWCKCGWLPVIELMDRPHPNPEVEDLLGRFKLALVQHYFKGT